ncbi:MAG: flavin monoamine oxidase family protein [Pseudolabrys sp.]
MPAFDPALGAVPASGEVDVVIIGAGAAGIAAARRVAAAGRRFALIEASNRIGGRAFTETRSLGAAFDRGAHALYAADTNPLLPLAARAGFETATGPRLQKLRVGRRFGREGEIEDFLASVFRSRRAIADAVRGKGDVPAARVLPKDLLDDWKPTVDFVLGAYSTGRDLADLSAIDLSRMTERDSPTYVRRGLGALIAKLGEGVPAQLSTPATKIEWLKTLEVETERGKLRARTVIVTASASVLAAGKIKFTPELPKPYVDAFTRLKLGSRDRIGLEMSGNPFGLAANDLVFEKASGSRTGALLAHVNGSTVCAVDIGGKFGAELSAQGETVMTDFAVSWLADLYGSDVKSAVKRQTATRWNNEPWIMGAIASAAPGGDGARRQLSVPVRERVWFAGDAVHDTLGGTLTGAWESGTRAAEAALRKIGAIKDEKPEKQPARGRERTRRRNRDQ